MEYNYVLNPRPLRKLKQNNFHISLKIHDPKFSPEKCDDLYFFRIFPASSTGRYLTPCDIQISVLFVGNEGRKLVGGGMTWSWVFDEEINYELEMDIELIASRVEDPHIGQGICTASNCPSHI